MLATIIARLLSRLDRFSWHPWAFHRSYIQALPFIVALVIANVPRLLSQTSPMPDVLPGPTAVAYNSSTGEYMFHAIGVDYMYSIGRGGSFQALTARRNGEEFFPSAYGGVTADLDGKNLEPWSSDGLKNLGYALRMRSQVGDTINLTWVVRYEADSTSFTLHLHLAGQTLVIDVEGDGSGKLSGVGFSQSLPAEETKVIRVPYLTLFGILYRKEAQSFVSLFADWEQTNASSITPWLNLTSTAGGYYSQRLEYAKTTSGRRNNLKERIYLSVAGELRDVLPNVVGPVAPRLQELTGRIVLSYGRFFPWILNVPGAEEPTPKYLDRLYESGVRDLAIIIKDWSKGQFDHSYPCTWPPDEYQKSSCWGARVASGGEGGTTGLRNLRDAVRSKGYYFGLHENYTDFHASACDLAAVIGPGEYRGLLPDGRPVKTFFNDCRDHPSQSWLLKPSKLDQVARWSMGEIVRGMGGSKPVDWSYLDVSSAVNPSGPISWDPDRSFVDFDEAVQDGGKFIGTLKAYRHLPAIARSIYQGPIQGEGTNHFLYAGYFDSFEARLVTADDRFSGERVPLLLDFDLRKLHGRSAYHGMGHIQYFFGSGNSAHEKVTQEEMLEYIATELAFGHAGLVTKGVLRDYDHSIIHASLEQQYAVPIQKMCATARVKTISYYDSKGPRTAGEYITDHVDGFDDYQSPEFMGRIKVDYENGVVIYVNRTNDPWAVTLNTPPQGWYSFHAVVNNSPKLGTGAIPGKTVDLPPKNGWIAFSPVKASP